MKKKLSNKLTLRKETLGSLNSSEMSSLKGGISIQVTCAQSVPAVVTCPCGGVTAGCGSGFLTCKKCK